VCWEWCWEAKSGQGKIFHNRLIFLASSAGIEPTAYGFIRQAPLFRLSRYAHTYHHIRSCVYFYYQTSIHIPIHVPINVYVYKMYMYIAESPESVSNGK
jgi:hypothetical protein